MAKTAKRTTRGTPRTPTAKTSRTNCAPRLGASCACKRKSACSRDASSDWFEENSQKLAEFCVYVMAMKTGENKTDTLERIEADAPRP
jgi:hypothetical protein